MMEAVLRDVAAAVVEEIKRIREAHGSQYASAHEAYGVLAEEIYEAEIEVHEVNAYAGMLLRALHQNDKAKLCTELSRIRNAAAKAACEFIQVAAVCEKALGGLKDGKPD